MRVLQYLEDLDDFFAVTFYGPGDRILDLIPEEGVTDLRALGLNERQIEALRLMVNEGKGLGNADHRRLFNVSKNTASRDLQSFSEDRVGESQRNRQRDTLSGGLMERNGYRWGVTWGAN